MKGPEVVVSKPSVEAMCGKLEEAMAALDLLRMERDAFRDGIMAPVRLELMGLDAEYEPRFEEANQAIRWLEDDIKYAVLVLGESVKSEHIQAQYVKARVSWNTKALDGYAVAHPELESLRTTGEPSVRIVRK